MDYNRRHQQPTRSTEPAQVNVKIQTGKDGHIITFTNDGITTTRAEDGDISTILQPRAAFRGFVMALTDLMRWDIVDAWDSRATRDSSI